MSRRRSPIHQVDVGIVGGGQLARMTAERAAKLGLTVAVLDPAADCAAASLAGLHIRAGFGDPEGLRRLVEASRVTTFDIELADTVELGRLEALGHVILPRPSLLATIQDKLLQRSFLASRGLPVPRFEDLREPTLEAMSRFGFPLVQKARRGGYDGRGVAVIESAAEFDQRLEAASVVEERIPIARELAALVVRNRSGAMATYPLCELFPDPGSHVLDALVFPAMTDQRIDREARLLAQEAVAAMEGVGIFAVELFLDTSGGLWVNEISPRPHNAGHVTIEAASTCQFEQHLRAILDLPPGDTGIVSPGAMVNILGPAGINGAVRPEALGTALKVPGARLHLYGKTRSWPGRKLGHLTVLDRDPVRALHRAREARSRLRFVCAGEVAA